MNTKITLVELARLMAEATSTKIRVCELFLRELFATISQATARVSRSRASAPSR